MISSTVMVKTLVPCHYDHTPLERFHSQENPLPDDYKREDFELFSDEVTLPGTNLNGENLCEDMQSLASSSFQWWSL